MKRIKALRIIGVALILSLLFTAIGVLPAFAAESIAINPTQAQVGATVTYSGSGYPASADEWFINVYISDQVAAVNNVIDSQVTRYKELDITQLSATGTFSDTFEVPETLNEGTLGTSSPLTLAAGSTYYIYVCGRYQYGSLANKQIKAITNLTISPEATLDPLSPASGPAGTSVLVTGSGFPASTALVFKFDTTTITPTSGHTSTLSSGLFLSYITIPSTATVGTHTVNVTAGAVSVSRTFTVTASAAISLSSTSGIAGSTVTITGSGYPASTALVFKFDTTTITPVSGDTVTSVSGTFYTIIAVPSSATVGTHTITATAGTSTDSESFTVTGAITPTLNTPTPASGPAGTNVAISGSNFPASTTLVFKFDTTTLTPTGNTQTNSDGSFSSVIVIPSSATVGAHTITVTAGSSTATTTFTVTASAAISLSSTSDFAGSTVTITGSNYPASTTLVFKFGTTTLTPTGNTQTNSDGSFSSDIVIPSDAAAGAYTITVTAGGSTATATFTITETSTTTPPPTTTTTLPLSLDQEAGDYVGSTISIGASGFTPNSPVIVTIEGTIVAEKNTDASGFVVITFKAPSIQGGEHTVTATDGTNTASANFTIESTPPTVPQPLLPTMGEAVSQPVSFDWEDVTDISSPVTYNLQIATSSTFEVDSIVIDKTDITKSEYILTEMEQLKLSSEVTYYWREQAVDAALNESVWTGAGEFTITKPFEFTGWPLYLTMGLGGLFLFLLGLWVGRRTAFYY